MPRRILIVDDNALNRQMLVNTLGRDYDIFEAENGKEALRLMHRYYKLLSAVLLDIVMPEMDGYDVLRAARENALLAQIPIIMVTGSEDEGARVKALSLGANDFILKPFNPDIVKHCLRNNITLRETASILNAIQKDKLTGLYNRDTFFEKADAMIRSQPPGYYMLSCFDIDNFKLINDQYGATEGDRILRETGHAVRENMDSIGGIAGRISADNFAVLFPVSREDTDVLQRIQDKKLVSLERQSVFFSVGRYIVTDRTLPASAIYDRAYIAKGSVKGRYDKHLAYFDEVMLRKLVQDQQIIGEMEAALAERQFEVWFQPQYNHDTGTLIGAEALARWRHPSKGIVAPIEFIPLFEQNGFVYELDKFVWREVCRYLRKWLDEGYTPLPVSMNVSRYDIFRADLVEVLTGIVREFDIPYHLLHLEITESAFAHSTDVIVQIVKQLIQLGFTVEIDDFGSGYSSLNTLKSVPAQVVKLDMRFLEDDDGGQRGGNILESIVRMTKWLGISVIAEGVETKEQGDFLKSIGCSHVQGYLYARPMPASRYELLCRNARVQALPVQTIVTVANLNNNTFWDPKSMDTLIFNSFVGAACIFEYYNDGIELLRANDRFAAILGNGHMTVEDTLKLDWISYLTPESLARVRIALQNSVDTGEDVQDEYVFRHIPGGQESTYLRICMRVIAVSGERRLVYCICEDITAQRMAEQSERRVNKQLQAVLDNVHCGISVIATRDGKSEYILTNDRYFEMLGYTRAQYRKEIGDIAFMIVHPEDRPRVQEVIARVCETGVPATMEFRGACRDGCTIWLRCYTSMTSFEGIDAPVHINALNDITAEKQAAQELLDNLPGGAVLCTYDGEDLLAVHLNKRFWELVDRAPVSYAHMSLLDGVHPEDRRSIMTELALAVAEKRDASCDMRVRYGMEGYRAFHVVGRIVPKEDGIYTVYTSYTPISDESMSFREMLPIALAAVMSSAPDLSFVKDKNLRYICCSNAFAKMVGYDNPQDVVGKTDFDLFDASFAQRYVHDDRALMKSRQSIIDMIERIPSADGRNRFSNTSKYLLYDAKGNVVGLYGTGRDITEAREAESQQKFLVNSIPGGVAIYEGTWKTLESIRLTYFSDGFCRLFGYTREEYEQLGQKNPTGLVDKEYIPALVKQIESLVKIGTPIDYIYRARTKTGDLRWIHIKAVLGEPHGDNMVVNAVLFDVTERQAALERLRMSEEENRLAIQHSRNVVCRYEIASRSMQVSPSVNAIFELPEVITDVPYGPVRAGRISPETLDAYIAFYESINHGEKSAYLTYQRKSTLGWRWIEARSSTIFSSDNEPISAVISYLDVTESYEKDAAYRKWLQSLHNKKPDSYSLFRCNISRETIFDTHEGSLLPIVFAQGLVGFNDHTAQYVDQCVHVEDAERFRAFLNAASLLEKYYHGERTAVLEYRENLASGAYRWLRLTVDLVEYAHSTDVEAYLLFEDIDEVKRAQLLTMERAQTDPLTGVLNRTTFAERVNELINAAKPGAQHALMMLDIDGFKMVNDAFGHGAGDQTLIDIANLLRLILRRDDLVGRLGGDEFAIFLHNIPGEKIAATKAKQICDLTRKAYNADVQISGSVGIAVCPSDGTSFDVLYKMADETLYHVKSSGRDNFAFYQEDMQDERPVSVPVTAKPSAHVRHTQKRRMLIVDDNKIDFEVLANMFCEEYLIEKAADGKTALTRLRHYGSAISVVLLDLMMPVMDGFAVLERMQQSPDMRSIPVIVVSADDNRETSLKAIRMGATDFVNKPVDADILAIRVQSAVSKAENERLRAKNSFLEMQNSETARYKTVLDRIGLAIVEMDWIKGTFVYGSSMTKHLSGQYDDRPLWHILLSDMVADAQTVGDIQRLVHEIADDRNCAEGCLSVFLKAASGEKRPFTIHIYKMANEYGLTDKIILTFYQSEGTP